MFGKVGDMLREITHTESSIRKLASRIKSFDSGDDGGPLAPIGFYSLPVLNYLFNQVFLSAELIHLWRRSIVPISISGA